MNPKTLKALRESIAHWKRLATGKRNHGEDTGDKDCALCKLFLEYGCLECPVFKRTGKQVCFGSPYGHAADAREIYGLDSMKFKSAARKQLEFLQSLLPKAKK